MQVLLDKYPGLKKTLQYLKRQVIDSLPYVEDYIPSDIETPEELFYYLRDITTYKKDPKGVELLQSIQTLLSRHNRHGIPGAGDCDCFTILTLASCEHLGFTPLQVVLVGNSMLNPSHIYTQVYDAGKKRMCVFDLTNPYYCQERKYNYKQTLDFNMKLELADLSGKADRKARRAARQQNRTKRVAVRQDNRTNRVENRFAKKSTKRLIKAEKPKKKLLKVQGRQDIIKARTQKKLDRINTPQDAPQEYAPDFSPQPFYNPSFEPQPADPEEYASEEYYDEFELLPQDEYSEDEELSGGLIDIVSGAIKGAVQKVKGKVAPKGQLVPGAIDKGAQLLRAQREVQELRAKVSAYQNQRYMYGGGGLVAGFLIGRFTK